MAEKLQLTRGQRGRNSKKRKAELREDVRKKNELRKKWGEPDGFVRGARVKR